MEQKLIHKHYIGSAHTFEILKQDPARMDVAILKTFFIDDTVNANDWQATWEGLKQDAEELLGTPLVLQEDLEHPKFSVQKMFDRGTIFDYDLDETNHKIIVYVRITDPVIIERIKSGELEYVSPALIPRGSEYMENIDGVDVLSRTLPLHLAIVGDPAYGKQKAKMTHLCTGDGLECYHRLKMMKVASKIYFTASELQDCVSRKIKIIKDEKPSISNEQAAAIAYSMCRAGTADVSSPSSSPSSTGIDSILKISDSASDVVGPLTQIPFIKKMIASASRLESIFAKMKTGSKYHFHNGKEGHWIRAKGMDVFVARNQSIKSALLDQCGCAKLGATEGKISKFKADYHKTDSTTKNCHSCRFFRPDDNYCEVVDGHIEPYYVSDLWQPKK